MANNKRPWFKFDADAWFGDPDLRLCSIGAKGLLADLMALAHNGNPYGYITNGNRALEIQDIARLENLDLETLGDLMWELQEHTRIIHDEHGYGVPRMIRDGQQREQQTMFGAEGGNPAVMKAAANEHKREAAEILKALPDKFLTLWIKWRQERRDMRRPMSDFAELLQLRKCKEWGEHKASASIKQSIERGWTGLFEPKDYRAPEHSVRKPNDQVLWDNAYHSIQGLLTEAKHSEKFGATDEVARVLKSCRDKYKDVICLGRGDVVSIAYEQWKKCGEATRSECESDTPANKGGTR
jgi:hypothetical protein